MLDAPTLPASYWVQPKGFGSDIGTYVPQFLIGVEKGSGDDLTITLGTTLGAPSSGTQDTCVPTTQVTASGASYPNIQMTTTTLPMRIWDTQSSVYVPSTAHDVTFKNLLPGNPDSATAELDATVDVAELHSLFYQIPNPTADNVCATFKSYSVPCETCSFNGQPYCLTLKAVQVSDKVTPAPAPIQKIATPSCS